MGETDLDDRHVVVIPSRGYAVIGRIGILVRKMPNREFA